jgi:hypothetical protein
VRSDATTAGGGVSADGVAPDDHFQPGAEVLASRRRSITSSGGAAVEEDDGRRSSVREKPGMLKLVYATSGKYFARAEKCD